MSTSDASDPGLPLEGVVAQALIKGILERSWDAIALEERESGRLVEVSASFCALSGYRAEELIGRSQFAVGLIDGDTAQAVRETDRHGPATRYIRLRRKDGAIRDLESSAQLVTSELILTIGRDVSERREAGRVLEPHTRLLDHAHEAMIVRELADSRVSYWNRAARVLYGYSTDEAVGQFAHVLLATVFPHSREAVDRALARDGQWAGDLRQRRKDGSEIEVSSRQALLRDDQDRPMAIIELNSNVIEQRAGELDRTRALEARVRAESASRVKSEFLARVSHELRTPLNAIIGFGQLLELEALDRRQSDYLGQMLTGGRQLLALINELLELARAETGALKIAPESVAVGDAASEVLALVTPLADERDITLCSAPDGPANEGHVYADPQRLKQVLLNLVSNAIKYNHPGGRVDVTLVRTRNGRVRTTVADTGGGIEPAQLAKLYEPFEQLGADRSQSEGAGLGLALAKAMVEAMGGTIEADSKPGLGTAFTIELAGAETPAARLDPARDDPQARKARHADHKPTVILDVEDDPSHVTLVEQILQRFANVELVPVMQGTLALALARHYHPGLIILDLHLPDMPGAELLKHLTTDRRTRDIPVVALTADASQSQSEQTQQLGAAAYLTKPLDVPRFLETIAGILAAPGRSCWPPRTAPERR